MPKGGGLLVRCEVLTGRFSETEDCRGGGGRPGVPMRDVWKEAGARGPGLLGGGVGVLGGGIAQDAPESSRDVVGDAASEPAVV